ncbi:MAG: hypothetical protein II837_15530 [Treponema sp.]|nr:hypothetical protein [Treponema sp.]
MATFADISLYRDDTLLVPLYNPLELIDNLMVYVLGSLVLLGLQFFELLLEFLRIGIVLCLDFFDIRFLGLNELVLVVKIILELLKFPLLLLEVLADFLFFPLGLAYLLVKDLIFAVGLYVVHVFLAHFPVPDGSVKFLLEGFHLGLLGLILRVLFKPAMLETLQRLFADIKRLGKLLHFFLNLVFFFEYFLKLLKLGANFLGHFHIDMTPQNAIANNYSVFFPLCLVSD